MYIPNSISNFRKRAFKAIGATVFLAISFNLVRFWEYRIEINGDVVTAEILLTKNSHYNLWYVTAGSQLVIYILPLIVLITFNLLISIELKKAVRKRSQMSKDQKDDRRTTRMMNAVVIGKLYFYTSCLHLLP